jgi:DMSO/TMAO reductase YedYZ molybdopterin-dependent catalytic subunit
MAPRHVNLGLLALLGLALGTGALAFGVGVPAGRAVVIAHGLAGLGLVVLAPWKTAIARRGLRRRRTGRAVSIALSALVVAAVATGLAHAAGLRVLPAGLTSMQLHVGAALVAVVPAVWHVVARPTPVRRTDLSRRTLLRTARTLGIAGAGWAAWEVVAGADRRFTGSHEVGTDRPERMPVTQWLADTVPVIDADAWRLTVTDAAGTRTLALGDLGLGDEVRATVDCTGGWQATQDWSGIAVRRLVTDPGDARSLVVLSATGYARRLPLRDLDTLLLATTAAGAPLSPGHGAPARLVAPGRRGFWWVKWVTEIRTDPAPWWWQPPFPLQ